MKMVRRKIYVFTVYNNEVLYQASDKTKRGRVKEFTPKLASQLRINRLFRQAAELGEVKVLPMYGLGAGYIVLPPGGSP